MILASLRPTGLFLGSNHSLRSKKEEKKTENDAVYAEVNMNSASQACFQANLQQKPHRCESKDAQRWSFDVLTRSFDCCVSTKVFVHEEAESRFQGSSPRFQEPRMSVFAFSCCRDEDRDAILRAAVEVGC